MLGLKCEAQSMGHLVMALPASSVCKTTDFRPNVRSARVKAIEGTLYTNNCGGAPGPYRVSFRRNPIVLTSQTEDLDKIMPRDTPRRRDSLPCVESYISYSTIDFDEIALSISYVAGRERANALDMDKSFGSLLLQSVAPKFSQVVLLKIAPLAEETSIGRGFFVVFILQDGEFDTASEVRHLEHPILGWSRIPIYDGIPEEGVLKRCVKNAGDEGLAVIVVDLDEFEFGELIEVVKQELGQVALHGTDELIRRLESILSIGKDVVAERRVLRERAEGHEELETLRCIEVTVFLVCPEERVEVEGDIWETPARERLFVQINRVGEVVALVMKDQGDQVVLGFSPEVAGLIYKDGELLHETPPLDTKSAGGNPPALDSPLLRGDHPSYTTSRSAESIVCEPEHKFVTIEANTCSTYREAA